jgi:hypothetical protein
MVAFGICLWHLPLAFAFGIDYVLHNRRLCPSLPEKFLIFIKEGYSLQTLNEKEMKKFPTICNPTAHL